VPTLTSRLRARYVVRELVCSRASLFSSSSFSSLSVSMFFRCHKKVVGESCVDFRSSSEGVVSFTVIYLLWRFQGFCLFCALRKKKRFQSPNVDDLGNWNILRS
jgi:hypothetical protein